jgi:hypothetical protein
MTERDATEGPDTSVVEQEVKPFCSYEGWQSSPSFERYIDTETVKCILTRVSHRLSVTTLFW